MAVLTRITLLARFFKCILFSFEKTHRFALLIMNKEKSKIKILNLNYVLEREIGVIPLHLADHI